MFFKFRFDGFSAAHYSKDRKATFETFSKFVYVILAPKKGKRGAVGCGGDVSERTLPLQFQYGGWRLRRRTTSSRFLPQNCCKAAAVTDF